MKKIIYIVVLLVLVLTYNSCKPKAGFGKDKKISGIVYLTDSISSKNIAVQNATVYVGFEADPSANNYNYKTVTNSLGEFTFDYLYDQASSKAAKFTYHLYTVYEQPGTSRRFENTMTTNAPAEDIAIILSEKDAKSFIEGNILLRDSLSNTLKGVSGADVFFGYSFAPTSSHYTFKVQSDANGRFVSPKIDPNSAGAYIILGQKTIKIGGSDVLFSRSVTQPQADSLNKNIELFPSDNIGYLTIKVLDVNQTPQPGFTTCIFANQAVFSNTLLCTGSFYSSVTNNKGLVYVSGLNPGSKYYLKTYRVLPNDTIIKKDSIILQNTLYPIYTTMLN